MEFGVWSLELLKGMESARLRGIVERYPRLRVAVLGDFCLDRYLEIDPAKQEVSLETGLPVHVAEDPLSAVAEGTGKCLNEIKFLRQVATSDRQWRQQ